MLRTARVLAAAAIAGLALSACGSSSTPVSAGASSAAPTIIGTVTVFAAASLKEAFTTLGQQFEAAHPGVKVVFSFAASSDLATQITQGAPADVFASASAKNMTQVTAAGYASGPVTFAKNSMEVALPPSNPAKITALSDLAKAGVKVALCQVLVPCGSTAAKVFVNAGLVVKPVTLEADVKSVLAKVELGEVDAGMVYVTDVLSAGTKVVGLPIAAAVNASTAYPIAALTKSANAAAAQAFVAYVLSAAGSTVLTADGFAKP